MRSTPRAWLWCKNETGPRLSRGADAGAKERAVTIRVKLSETGEIVIPKDVREAHHWGAGTELELLDQGGGIVLRPITESKPRASKAEIEAFLAARLKVNRPYPTPEEIKGILLEEAETRFNATRD